MADAALDRLCRHFGLDPAVAGAAVGSAGAAASPWYLRVATGIGAWLTAAAMILAVGLVLGEAVDGESLPIAAAVLGGLLAAGATVMHRAGPGEFAGRFAVAAALAGQALVVGGIGAETGSTAVAAAVAVAAAALLAALIRDPELQFLAVGGAAGTVFLALLQREVPQASGILVAVTLPAALPLLLRPPAGRDLRGLAWALLLAPLAAMSLPEVGGLGGDWLPRLVYAAALVAVLALLWRTTAPGRRAVLLAGGAVALGVGTVAAAGITGSLLLLTLAYLLGSRMLAVLGAAAQLWFVSRFYYDLELTLLQKSAMLAAAGLLLLALWWLWARREAGDA